MSHYKQCTQHSIAYIHERTQRAVRSIAECLFSSPLANIAQLIHSCAGLLTVQCDCEYMCADCCMHTDLALHTCTLSVYVLPVRCSAVETRQSQYKRATSVNFCLCKH